MHPVDVLVGVDLHERGVVVDLRRRGVLDEEGVDARVVVQLADRGDDVGLRRVVAAGGCAATSSPSSAAFFIFMPT